MSARPTAAARSRKPLSRLAMFAFSLAVLVGLLAAFAGFGSKLGWWHFGTGFSLLRWAVYGGIATGVLSLIALFLTRPGGHRRGLVPAVLGLIVSLAVVGVPWWWRQRAAPAPPIHDITTDTENPPRFSAVLPLRADAPNPPEYGGPEIAAQQREAFPNIQPLTLTVPPEQSFELALEAARDMGWEIVEADAAAGRIEATDETFWFGFKDDVVIRVTGTDEGSRVDVRSVSRVGRGDMGTNARRVRAYLEELRDG